ncbi:hypothetical protein [Rickettsiella grylli]|uniref:Uncharacterized protein n=1 Tax=Rickettsiella grylli TaxID=59196 RepID=A8PL54_9COXI|nr:hypothetical protein [Rickettsiella grylli]EDP47044.1 hypothetical protein RICGR_0237 [Rickettsiella grylli]
MEIPFGSRAPNKKEFAQLKQLGFDPDKITFRGRYYFLEIPSDPRIQVNELFPAFDRREIHVQLNGFEVISINQKTAIYDSWVFCNLNKKNIEQALLCKEFIPEKKQELTEYQKRLNGCLRSLEIIIFEDGAQRGYANTIGDHLQQLIKLSEENPNEHNKLIAHNKNYTQLYEMFPHWVDQYELQKKYSAMEVNPLTVASTGHYDGTLQQCRPM